MLELVHYSHDFLIPANRVFAELSKRQCLVYYSKPLIAAINVLCDGECCLQIKISRWADIKPIDLILHMYTPSVSAMRLGKALVGKHYNFSQITNL